MLVEAILGVVGVGAGGALLAHRVAKRRRARAGPSVAGLADAVGGEARLVGRVTGPVVVSPVTSNPCVAWWCWVDRVDLEGRIVPVGAAAHGDIFLEDGTGRLGLEASECRLGSPPGGEISLLRADWPAEGASAYHDGLRAVCRAAGLESVEHAGRVRLRESLLPPGVAIEVRGLVLAGSGATSGAGYRERGSGTARLCPPPGGWIELVPR